MKAGGSIRLSPNEEARLLKEEKEKRRKLRLIQVREQAKQNAAKIRAAVRHEKEKQLDHIGEQIKNNWEQEKNEKVKRLEELYLKSLKTVGEGHREALLKKVSNRPEDRKIVTEENNRKAEVRHKHAVAKEKKVKAQKDQEANKQIVLRQTALEVEKGRASRIASLPPPPPDPIAQLEQPKVKPVRTTDAKCFANTYYHIPEVNNVEKADTEEEQDNAITAADEVEEQIQEIEAEKKRINHEYQEKARLRYKSAISRELLKQDYDKMMLELSDLQRADANRRSQAVAKIPKQIFLPPSKRQENKVTTQQGMEQAFEEMYMVATDYMGDMSLALDPHPAPETPAQSDVLDLSSCNNNGSYDESRNASQQDLAYPAPKHSSKNHHKERVRSERHREPSPPRKERYSGSGIKRLMGKIKQQRKETWGGTQKYDRDNSRHKEDESMNRLSEPSLTQYTLTNTSANADSSADTSMSHGRSDTTKTTTTTEGTLNTLSTCPETGGGSLDTGSIRSDSSNSSNNTVKENPYMRGSGASATLLHPMEEAAKIRKHSRDKKKEDVSHFLEADRKRHQALKKEHENLEKQTREDKRKIENYKADLQNRIRDIEKTRRMLQNNLHNERGGSVASHRKSDATEVPRSSNAGTQNFLVNRASLGFEGYEGPMDDPCHSAGYALEGDRNDSAGDHSSSEKLHSDGFLPHDEKESSVGYPPKKERKRSLGYQDSEERRQANDGRERSHSGGHRSDRERRHSGDYKLERERRRSGDNKQERERRHSGETPTERERRHSERYRIEKERHHSGERRSERERPHSDRYDPERERRYSERHSPERERRRSSKYHPEREKPDFDDYHCDREKKHFEAFEQQQLLRKSIDSERRRSQRESQDSARPRSQRESPESGRYRSRRDSPESGRYQSHKESPESRRHRSHRESQDAAGHRPHRASHDSEEYRTQIESLESERYPPTRDSGKYQSHRDSQDSRGYLSQIESQEFQSGGESVGHPPFSSYTSGSKKEREATAVAMAAAIPCAQRIACSTRERRQSDPNLRAEPDTSLSSETLDTAQKVREYQERLLARQEERQIQILQARIEMEERTKKLLEHGIVEAADTNRQKRGWPARGENESSASWMDKESVIAGHPANREHHSKGSQLHVTKGSNDILQGFGGQTCTSMEGQGHEDMDDPMIRHTEQKAEQSLRQAELQAQLLEIQKQKHEILEKQRRHHQEIESLKSKWDVQLDHLKEGESLVNDTLGQQSCHLEERLEDTKQKHNDRHKLDLQINKVRKMEQAELLEKLTELSLEEGLGPRPGISAVSQGSSHPATSQLYYHDLSTIQEMDTPHSEKRGSRSQVGSAKRGMSYTRDDSERYSESRHLPQSSYHGSQFESIDPHQAEDHNPLLQAYKEIQRSYSKQPQLRSSQGEFRMEGHPQHPVEDHNPVPMERHSENRHLTQSSYHSQHFETMDTQPATDHNPVPPAYKDTQRSHSIHQNLRSSQGELRMEGHNQHPIEDHNPVPQAYKDTQRSHSIHQNLRSSQGEFRMEGHQHPAEDHNPVPQAYQGNQRPQPMHPQLRSSQGEFRMEGHQHPAEDHNPVPQAYQGTQRSQPMHPQLRSSQVESRNMVYHQHPPEDHNPVPGAYKQSSMSYQGQTRMEPQQHHHRHTPPPARSPQGQSRMESHQEYETQPSMSYHSQTRMTPPLPPHHHHVIQPPARSSQGDTTIESNHHHHHHHQQVQGHVSPCTVSEMPHTKPPRYPQDRRKQDIQGSVMEKMISDLARQQFGHHGHSPKNQKLRFQDMCEEQEPTKDISEESVQQDTSHYSHHSASHIPYGAGPLLDQQPISNRRTWHEEFADLSRSSRGSQSLDMAETGKEEKGFTGIKGQIPYSPPTSQQRLQGVQYSLTDQPSHHGHSREHIHMHTAASTSDHYAGGRSHYNERSRTPSPYNESMSRPLSSTPARSNFLEGRSTTPPPSVGEHHHHHHSRDCGRSYEASGVSPRSQSVPRSFEMSNREQVFKSPGNSPSVHWESDLIHCKDDLALERQFSGSFGQGRKSYRDEEHSPLCVNYTSPLSKSRTPIELSQHTLPTSGDVSELSQYPLGDTQTTGSLQPSTRTSPYGGSRTPPLESMSGGYVPRRHSFSFEDRESDFGKSRGEFAYQSLGGSSNHFSSLTEHTMSTSKDSTASLRHTRSRSRDSSPPRRSISDSHRTRPEADSRDPLRMAASSGSFEDLSTGQISSSFSHSKSYNNDMRSMCPADMPSSDRLVSEHLHHSAGYPEDSNAYSRDFPSAMRPSERPRQTDVIPSCSAGPLSNDEEEDADLQDRCSREYRSMDIKANSRDLQNKSKADGRSQRSRADGYDNFKSRDAPPTSMTSSGRTRDQHSPSNVKDHSCFESPPIVKDFPPQPQTQSPVFAPLSADTTMKSSPEVPPVSILKKPPQQCTSFQDQEESSEEDVATKLERSLRECSQLVAESKHVRERREKELMNSPEDESQEDTPEESPSERRIASIGISPVKASIGVLSPVKHHQCYSPSKGYEPGITDESALTLVSDNSDESPEEETDGSLESFEQHERNRRDESQSNSKPSPAMQARLERIAAYPKGLESYKRTPSKGIMFKPMALHFNENEGNENGFRAMDMEGAWQGNTEGMTLQEMFEKKRKDFIKASKTRQNEAKIKAATTSKSQGHLGKTVSSWKKSRGLRRGKSTTTVSSVGDVVERTSEHRKKNEKDMKKRTSRLYGQLDEVKQAKLEKTRKEQYAQNREKMKEYHKKHREKALKKPPGKKPT